MLKAQVQPLTPPLVLECQRLRLLLRRCRPLVERVDPVLADEITAELSGRDGEIASLEALDRVTVVEPILRQLEQLLNDGFSISAKFPGSAFLGPYCGDDVRSGKPSGGLIQGLMIRKLESADEAGD